MKKFLSQVFSVKNENDRKVLTVLGLKCKFYNANMLLRKIAKENEALRNDVRFLKRSISKILTDKQYIHTVNIKGFLLHFQDCILSDSVNGIAQELNEFDAYNFDDIDFKEGDIVVDIGGNIGMISIYLAKKYPFLKIYAFEPVRENYENFKENIKLNNIPEGIITLYNKAVTKDGRKVAMNINYENKGGSAISDVFATNYNYSYKNIDVDSITLEEIFKQHNIEHLKLLKIDCEGCEYEILYNTPTRILSKISILRGEFHENPSFTSRYNASELEEHCSKYIDNVNVSKLSCAFVIDKF